MADEPLHEIQLNGKQLVFLFMSATVVAVVIFLSGVMVGRGVRAPLADPGEVSGDELTDPTAPTSETSAAATPYNANAGPATAQEDLTYPDRLGSDAPQEETLREPGAAADPTALPAPVREPIVASAPAPPTTTPPTTARATTPVPVTPVPPPAAATRTPPSPSTPSSTPPLTTAARPAPPAPAPAVASAAATAAAGGGFVVQVAATRDRGEADTIAKRLTGKGYPAFVTTPASGPQMFRVRVGTYKDRREAETVAVRLEREEQFKPWVTR